MKAVLDSLSDVAEAMRGEYEERDGKYVLKLEGDIAGMVKSEELADANGRLKEFRENNIRLNQKVEEFTAKFAGLDPEEFKAAKLELEQMKAKTNGAKGQEEQWKVALDAMQQKLDAKEKSEAEKDRKIEASALEAILIKEGVAAGIDQRAVGDFVRRGRETFVYSDGAAVAMDGDKPLYSEKRPAEALSVAEWITGLSVEAPYFFKASRGGGAQGGTDGKPGNAGIVIDPNDDDAFLENLDKIAEAKVTFRE